MIPSPTLDPKLIDTHLLFGQPRAQRLNTAPLDIFEIQLLQEIISNILANYQDNPATSIGGNWGLISLSFNARNGIIIYQEFSEMKRQGKLTNLPEQFITQISSFTPDVNTFNERCQLLNLSAEQLFRQHQFLLDGQNHTIQSQLQFQLQDRVLGKYEYTSQPGSLASDILEIFTYEEYINVRSLWSQDDLSDEELVVRDFVKAKQIKTKRRAFPQEEGILMERQKVPKRPTRPKRAKQFRKILQLVCQNKFKAKTKTKIKARKSPGSLRKRSHNRYSQVQKQATRRPSKYRQVVDKVTFEEANYNTMEQQEITQQQLPDDTHYPRPPTWRKKHYFPRLIIQRINLKRLEYSQRFPIELAQHHEYIQKQMTYLSNPRKVMRILNSTILNFLNSSDTRPDDIISLRIVSNILSIAAKHQSGLILDFIKYHILYSFSKLVGMIVFFIVGEEEDLPEIELGVLMQTFTEVKRVIAQLQLQQLTLTLCVNQFLHHFFGYYEQELEVSLPFSTKSLKVIYESIFQGSSMEAVLSCRLSEKLLGSLDIFSNPVASTQPISTAIAQYQKYLPHLSEQQFPTVIHLMLDIEDKYPTFWTFEQFSCFLNLTNLQKRMWTPKIQEYLAKCVRTYLSQQQKINNNNYKQLTNQILKQTFLGNKQKQGNAWWCQAYLSIVGSVLQFPIFKNAFVYRQIVSEIEGVKTTPQNCMTVFNMMMESLEFTTDANRTKYETQFQQSCQVKFNQYKEMQKILRVIDEMVDQKDRFKEFMKSRNQIDNQGSSSIEQMYTRLLQPTNVPQLLVLKFRFLLHDSRIQVILNSKNHAWQGTKQCVVKTLVSFLTNVGVRFLDNQPENSDSQDIQCLLKAEEKKGNYSKFLINLVANQYKKHGKSWLTMPLSVQSGEVEFVKKQFGSYGCKLATRVVIDQAVVAEIIKVVQYATSNDYSYLNKSIGIQDNFSFCSQLIKGALQSWYAWTCHKKVELTELFHECVCQLLVSMSLIRNLEQDTVILLRLYLGVYNTSPSTKQYWHRVLDHLRMQDNNSLDLQHFLQALICLVPGTTEIQNLMKRNQRALKSIKQSCREDSSYFALSVMDILHFMLRSGKILHSTETLINILKVRRNTQQMFVLSEVDFNQNTYGTVMRLLVTIHNHPNNAYKVKSILNSFVQVQIQKHFSSVMPQCSNPAQNQLAQNSPLETCFRMVQKYNSQKNSSEVKSSCTHLIGALMKELKEFPEAQQGIRGVVYNRTVNKIINLQGYFSKLVQGHIGQELLSQYHQEG